MLKKDELSSPSSCINKAADDEPVFVLRAQDAIAPDVVRLWAGRAWQAGVPQAKVNEAYDLASQMQAWQREHSAKVPD
jgi:hypothetical protein